MTKVGIYAILRVHSVVFGLDGAFAVAAGPWILGALWRQRSSARSAPLPPRAWAR